MSAVAQDQFAFCVECGAAFRLDSNSRVMLEWSPLGLSYYLGVCPRCEPFIEAIEAVADVIVTEKLEKIAQERDLSAAEKRYVGAPDPTADRWQQLGDALASLLDEVWKQEEWAATEARIDLAVRNLEAQERAKKRRKE